MTETQTDDDRDNEIVTFIGIPRKWVNPVLKIYSFLFLGYAIWVILKEFSGGTKALQERLSAIFTHLAAFGAVEVLAIVAIIQVVDLIMYLTNKFKTKVKQQVKEAKAEGIAEGRAQGEAKGRAQGRVQGRTENHQMWVAWNTRRMEAEARGIPFDEPPPELSKDTQDTVNTKLE